MLRTIALAGLLAFAASAVIAQAPSGALSAAAAECDRLAASAYDPDATAPGVDGNDIEHARAVPACEAAVAQHPEIPRLAFQLARVYGAAWRESDAARLYRKAADNGYVPAMNDLGYCYNEGRGLPIDKVEAVRWFRLGAGNGDVRSMDDLGTAYLDGAGVGSNAAEAMRWFRQAAARGYGPSMHSIGTIYQLGLGVTKDSAEAERWFRQAAQWYRQAAGKGAAFAMAGMGFIQQSGQGEPRDDDEAIRWFRRAAEKGSSAGMLGLGFMYSDGRGVPRDGGEAMRWYRQAAEKGSARAMTALGQLLADGQDVPRDEAEAVRWFRRAAEKGDAFGSFYLSASYGSLGVAMDAEEEARFLLLAVRGAESAILVHALRQLGGPVMSHEGCRALQRRLGDAGYYPGPIDDGCGAEVLQGLERFRESPPGPQ